MPEVLFRVRFPDGSRRDCYSPSTIVHEYLAAGDRHPMPEFLARVRAALEAASERVRAKYGFACSRSADEFALIEMLALRFCDDPEARFEIETISGAPPKPAPRTENRA